ncbi:hypothetical protein [Falsibacillus albus]|uniref:Uncharacterized protein n=1 Tax=Falsibacillus albus TaxID=2478915 RepID=A0A3L7K6J0_9BACI|nr:hypothetical protein [Falsibacillus albus]RLQ96322.1 hypothetical protein D9X91_08550 [Falsibacillus albus]
MPDEIEKESMGMELVDEDSRKTTKCFSVVHQNVCVEAIVTIKPHVRLGDEPKVICGKTEVCPHKGLDHPDGRYDPMYRKKVKIQPDCFPKHHHDDESCSFMVSQKLCIEIPLEFAAEAIVKPKKVACKDGDTGPCPRHPDDHDCGCGH